jgi:hypothetical protein
MNERPVYTFLPHGVILSEFREISKKEGLWAYSASSGIDEREISSLAPAMVMV